MMKAILSFVMLFVIFYMGIEIFRSMTGKEKWEAAKTFSYSLAISISVIVFLVLLVVAF
jgi:hypothetical protein